MDPSFVPPSQRSQTDQSTRDPSPRYQSPRRSTYSSWHQKEPWTGDGGWYTGYQGVQEDRSASPRQRTVPKKAKKPKKASQQPKGEGKGKTGTKGKYAIEPPAWTARRSSTTVALPSSAQSSGQSKAEAKLQELVAAMNKKKDTLDPDLQTLAQEAAQLQHQSATSKLMSAVSKHGDAKTALLETRQARANLHATWKQYLDSAIQIWRGFLEDFDTEDKKLEEQIQIAETALTMAQGNLDDAKKVATAQELQDQVEVVDDDLDMTDRTLRSGPAIREGLSGMIESLEKLQAQTEEATGETAKRQRLEDGTSKSLSTPAALQPFGKADR